MSSATTPSQVQILRGPALTYIDDPAQVGLEEALFIQMTMGDDRAVKDTYIAGVLAHSR
ncbi:MAG TPA: hypothetical protein VLC79_17175 [Cellvibrio sp.]|nr:hypothetical protein [Cellvibrio sp.]